MGADTQLIDGLLKDYVPSDEVAEQINNMFPLKDLFKTESEGFSGREVIRAAKVARNTSPMFVSEDSAFADAGNQTTVQHRIGQKKIMGRVRLTYEAMHDSLSSKAAYKSARKDEMESLVNDIALREEAALGSDGRGVLALVNGTASSATQTLDAPAGMTGADWGNRFFQVGMWVGTVNPASGALVSSSVAKVTSVAAAGTTIGLSASVSWTDNHYVVQVANSAVTDVADSSYENAYWGLMALIDDGTYRDNYFGVSRATWPSLKSYVKASTGALSADLYQQISDVVDQKMGGRITDVCMHHSLRRQHLQVTESDRRYDGNNLKTVDPTTNAFDQEDLPIGSAKVKALRTFPLATVAMLDRKNTGFIKYESEKGKWVDEDGSVLVRIGSGTTGRDAFEGWFRRRLQLFAAKPGKSARMDGVTGQSLIVVQAA